MTSVFSLTGYLKACRAKLGMTQAEVAKLCQTKKDTYRTWENGRNLPSLPMLPKLTSLYSWSQEEYEMVYTHVTQNGRRRRSVGTSMKPTQSDLGAFLREERLKLGLRQSDVAKKCGTSLVCYNQAERGVTLGARKALLPKLAVLFDCELAVLLALVPKEQVVIEEPKTELGKYIRERREVLHLSIEDLAERMQMTIPKMQQLEMGKSSKANHPARFVGSSLLPKLAIALEVRPKKLISFFDEANEKPIESALGKCIRERRKELGLSGNKLAAKLQITRQMMSYIERGNIPLNKNDALLVRIAAHLNLDPLVLREKRRGFKTRKKLV